MCLLLYITIGVNSLRICEVIHKKDMLCRIPVIEQSGKGKNILWLKVKLLLIRTEGAIVI